jgi:hypothetical protein
MSLKYIKPEVIEFSVYVMDKEWNHQLIKFPYTSKDGFKINIYNIDKISDIANKLYLITGINVELLHFRGLHLDFEQWINIIKPKKNEIIAGGASGSANAYDDDDDLEENKQNIEYQKFTFKPPVDKPMFLGYIHHTGDNIFPKIIFRGRDVVIDTPINAFYSPYNMEIKSMVADTQFAQFSNLTHDASDKFIIDFAPKNELVVIPLTAFILPKSIDAPYIANDSSLLSKVNDGFLVKYYPMLNETSFKFYLMGSLDNFNSSAIIEKIHNILDNEYETMSILTSVKYSAIDEDKLMKNFDLNVTEADIITKPKHENNLSLRNIFDKLHIQTTKDLNIIYMHHELTISPHLIGLLLNKDVRILITKYKQNGMIPRVTNELKKLISQTGALMIMISTTSKTSKNIPMMILLSANGEWTIRSSWNEHINIEQIMLRTQKITDGLIDLINNNIIYYGRNELSKLSKTHSQINNLSLNLIFHHTLTIPEFKIFRQNFSIFIEANMASYVSAVNFEVSWSKGILKPCLIKVIYSLTNIRFEILNTSLRDLSNLLPILNIYVMYSIDKIKNYNAKYKKKITDDDGMDGEMETRIIKKLRETDPKLYDNLRPGMIYSKKCQGIKQPEVFLESEIKTLSVKERKELTKYWNFTYDKPVYYRCQKNDSGNRLEFSFLTGINMNDYCIPCCKIKETKENSNKERMQNKCLTEHKYTEKYYNINPSSYVFIANKTLPAMRIGNLPRQIAEIFAYDKRSKYDGYFTYGTEQIIPALINTTASIVFAITDALDITVKEFILSIVANLKTKKITDEKVKQKRSLRHPQKQIAGGYQQEYIHNLIDALIAIFVNKVEFYNFSMNNWDEFFIYQALELYDVNVILFKIKSDEILIMDNDSRKIFIVQYNFEPQIYSSLETEIAFYPIYFINIKEFIAKGEISRKIFTKEIENINKQILTNQNITLIDIIKKGIKVTELFINKNNTVYAIKCEDAQRSVFLPVTYSHIYPKIKLNYGVFVPDANNSLELLLELIKTIGYKITAYITHNDKVIALELNKMNAYIFPIDKRELPEDILRSVSEIVSLVDLVDVNLTISQNKSPSDEYFTLMFNTYYDTYIYDIIKIEIINLIDSEKINPKEIYKLTVDDLAKLIPHKIDNAELTSNIIMPCASSVNMSHCTKEHELIVPANFKEYLEIALVEMKDKYRNFVRANKKNIVINILNFEQVYGEIIEWKLLG